MVGRIDRSVLAGLLGTVLCSLTLDGCASMGAGVSTSLVAGKKADDVIREAGEAGQGLVAGARSTGNALAAKMGNELTLVAATASKLLGDQIHSAVSALRGENAKLVRQIAEMNETARRFVPGAFALKDSLAVDLRALMGESIFAPRSRYFLQRIDGLTQLERSLGGDYKIEFSGLGFGTDSDRSRNRIVGITIDGQEITWRENRLHAFVTEIALANDYLRPHFADHELQLLSVNVVSEVETKALFGRWRKERFETPFYLSLMPKRGAKLEVFYECPSRDWVLDKEKSEFLLETLNHEREGDDPIRYPYNAEQKALPGTRFATPIGFSSQGEGCPWADQWGPEIQEGGAKLVFRAEAWGRPCAYRYWAKLQREEVVGLEKKKFEVDADYGRLLTVSLPKDVTFWRIAGTTATNDEIELVNLTSSELLKFVDRVDTGRDLRVTYRLMSPEGSFYSETR